MYTQYMDQSPFKHRFKKSYVCSFYEYFLFALIYLGTVSGKVQSFPTITSKTWQNGLIDSEAS